MTLIIQKVRETCICAAWIEGPIQSSLTVVTAKLCMPQGFKLGLKTGMKKNKNARVNVVAQCSCQSSSPSSFASRTIMNGPRNDFGLRFALSMQEPNWHLGSWQEGFYERLWGCFLKRYTYFMKSRSYSDIRNKRKTVKCFLNPIW